MHPYLKEQSSAAENERQGFLIIFNRCQCIKLYDDVFSGEQLYDNGGSGVYVLSDVAAHFISVSETALGCPSLMGGDWTRYH
jgi:hypothetical protein